MDSIIFPDMDMPTWPGYAYTYTVPGYSFTWICQHGSDLPVQYMVPGHSLTWICLHVARIFLDMDMPTIHDARIFLDIDMPTWCQDIP